MGSGHKTISNHAHFRALIKSVSHHHYTALFQLLTVCVSWDLDVIHTSIYIDGAPMLLQDIGHGKGKYYAVNFPLRDGIDDETYQSIFKPVSVLLFTFSFIGVSAHVCDFIPGTKLVSVYICENFFFF